MKRMGLIVLALLSWTVGQRSIQAQDMPCAILQPKVRCGAAPPNNPACTCRANSQGASCSSAIVANEQSISVTLSANGVYVVPDTTYCYEEWICTPYSSNCAPGPSGLKCSYDSNQQVGTMNIFREAIGPCNWP